MTINRQLWLRPFLNNNLPNWTCPRCNWGVLRPIEKSFQYWESADSHLYGRKIYIESGQSFDDNTMLGGDLSSYRYSVLLRCNNPECQEHVASCGSGNVIEEFVPELGQPDVFDAFLPEYFYPQLNIFHISDRCPETVGNEIQSSFKLFFSDPPASANYVRKSIDAILTHAGIRRYVTSNGKRKQINLHDRILDFQTTRPETARKLFAVKWLGNEGSHGNEITKNDILDAYEILESVLDDLYVHYGDSVYQKVLRINKLKKPLHPST